MIQIIEADDREDLVAAKTLFKAHRDEMGNHVCFVTFDRELVSLPGIYAPPSGRLFLAREDNVAVGVVALSAVSTDTSELRRMFVVPERRAAGIGGALARSAIDAAKQIGYKRVVLETLSRLNAAVGLYRSLGFEVVAERGDENEIIVSMSLRL